MEAAARYDDMAIETMRAARGKHPGYTDQSAQYRGPAKKRDPLMLQQRIDKADLDHWGHRIEGYANGPDPRLVSWRAEMGEISKDLTVDQKHALATQHRSQAHKMRERVEAARQRRAEEVRLSRRYGSGGRYAYGYSNARARAEQAERRRSMEEAQTEALATATALDEQADRLTALAKPKVTARVRPVQNAGAGSKPARGKTTPKSTPGSFATHAHGTPDVTLEEPAAGASDPFGDDSFWQ